MELINIAQTRSVSKLPSLFEKSSRTPKSTTSLNLSSLRDISTSTTRAVVFLESSGTRYGT